MKLFRTYIFPALYGLLVYFTVRLLHDIDVDAHFWKRDWLLNSFEMVCSILTGYASLYLFKRLFSYYDRRALQLDYRSIAQELLILILANLVLVCMVFIPMAAFTDDGLSWADVVDLTTIPTLYAIIYYGMARSSSWLAAYVNNKVQLEKMTNLHLESELKFLKAQYHPHFLFNALNTIYFQMDEDTAGAKRSIEKFSELLRYQLYDQQHQVMMGREIAYLQSFIDLQKMRSSDKLKLAVRFDQQLSEQLVYPLLFLPLVENAFKFVGGSYDMHIEAKLCEDFIYFSIENSLPLTIKSAISAGGIGLENLRKRLDLLYPEGRHQLKLRSAADVFKAELMLKYE